MSYDSDDRIDYDIVRGDPGRFDEYIGKLANQKPVPENLKP